MDGFHILNQLSNGSQTRAFRAIRRADGVEMILKIFRGKSDSEIGMKEFKMLTLLRDSAIDHVVRPLEIDTTSTGDLVLKLDPFRGKTIEQLVNDKFVPSVSQFLSLAIGLCETLTRLHKLQVVHGDLSSSNIMFRPETGDFCIVDFGSARTTPISASSISEATPFMSCEQTGRVNKLIDHRTDLYSLGVNFYLILTGRLPFTSTDPLELIHSILAMEPTPPHTLKNTIPKIISDIVMKLLSKDVEDRYQSAFSLKQDLERIQRQSAHNPIPNFPLAMHDAIIKPPSDIYGREEAIQTSILNFQEMMETKKPVVTLVHGLSGIGKSIMVRAVHSAVVAQFRETVLVSAKLDQFQRDPFGSFKLVIQELLSMVLSHSSNIEEWRHKLQEAVKPNGALLTSMFPLLESILGSQPPVTPLPPMESQARLTRLISKFLCQFCAEERPLIIFFDDMQWADQSSLQQLEEFCTCDQVHHIFFVVAYRDESFSENSPLSETLQFIETAGVKVEDLPLGGLTVTHVSEMLTAVLGTVKNQLELAKYLHHRTDGNPFFVLQFIQMMQREQQLVYVVDDAKNSGNWTFDSQALSQILPTIDIVQLVQSNIDKLDPEIRGILSLAACLRDNFKVETLSKVVEIPFAKLLTLLLHLQKDGFIDSVSEKSNRLSQGNLMNMTFHFTHDKIQEAAYECIPCHDRSRVHFQIGRALLESAQRDRIYIGSYFDIANHFNRSLDQITEISMKIQIAILNYWVCREARSSGSFVDALAYCRVGLQLTGVSLHDPTIEHLEENVANLVKCLFLEYSELLFLCGEALDAKKLFLTMLTWSRDWRETGKLYHNLIGIAVARAEFGEAFDLYSQAMSALGVPENEIGMLPENIQQEINSKLWRELQSELENLSIPNLRNYPTCVDPKQRLISRLCELVTYPSNLVKPSLAMFLKCQFCRRTLRFGWTGSEGSQIILLAIEVVSAGKLRMAQELAHLAMEIGDFVSQIQSQSSQTLNLNLEFFGDELKSLKIPVTSYIAWVHTQVHLRIPCYDFSFL
eukprot:TRINITY_DN2686_c0_g1_i3.p1 TRINITY_DN2686_c0_g1~~TRINITY_DN2686_c0_g1_i3.p1  ORF type:complete len:1044 (-),score=354.12 TRINITY_DN2686_c0_g1_i3:75-3176(-)